MKKNKYLTFVAMAAAALATSCASDDLAGQKQSQTGSQTVTLSASVNDDTNATTRVGMTKEGTNAKFYWHNSDAISVMTVNGSNYSNAKFTTTAENGATTATFTGDVTGKVGGYAVYPYSESHTFTSETALKYNLPAEYTNYKPETKIFGTNADYPTNSTNIPLVGKIEEGKIAFKHLGGLAVIRIDKMPSASGTLTVTADQQLSGYINVDLSADTPTLAASESAGETASKVEFKFEGAEKEQAGVFYLPLATGEYTNMKVTINSTEVDCGSVSISRAGVTAVSIATYEGELTTYKGELLCSYGNSKYYLGSDEYLINDHKFVDLGLSVLWAETNIGADKATDDGNYYAWGETTPKGSYTKDSYTYTYKATTLDATHDAASVNWGSSCRMPTNAEFGELRDNCDWTWDETNKGYKVTSKKQDYVSNSIFLPASGYYGSNGLSEHSSRGCYWSSTSYSNGYVWFLDFTTNRNANANYGWMGFSVRPAAKL